MNYQQGYSLYQSKTQVLDCYEAAHNKESDNYCIAMMANCPRKLVHSDTGDRACANAKLIVNQGVIYLISLCEIFPHTEIFYHYGAGYRHYIK